MQNSIKEEIKKILEIIKNCPDNLKEVCFKVLLEDALEQREKKSIEGKQAIGTRTSEGIEDVVPEIGKRVKVLSIQVETTPEQLLRVFSIDEDIVDIDSMIDLGSVKTATKQRKLAFLIAVSNFLSSGDYKISIEELRQKCVDFGAYDATNFTKNLKGMKSLLSGKFNLKQDQKLSADGKKEAVKLLKELIKKE